MTGQIGPDYRRLMDLIRSKIESGEYPVGEPIPSTTELRNLMGMSVPVVRRAVQQLEADGLLEGHPGKGVFVKATPAVLARERQETEALAQQLQALQRDVRELAERTDEIQPSDLARGLAELRETVGRVQIDLISLYQKTGHAYPQGGSSETRQPTPHQRQPEQ